MNNEDVASLCLTLPRDEEESAGRHFLAQLAQLIGKLATLEDRHTRLQKLAITDELTGLYNGRYFRHFLTRIIDKARTMRFPSRCCCSTSTTSRNTTTSTATAWATRSCARRPR
jgi:PleD family two-component response regulator